MTKQTKQHIKKNKKTKTKKYRGGSNSQGIFDIIGDRLKTYSGNVSGYIADKGLRLVGLQPIKQSNEPDNKEVSTNAVDNKIGQISDAASNTVSGLASNAKSIGSDIVNVFDKSSAAIVGQVNDVLESPKVGQSLNGALQETAEIGTKLLQNFNNNISNNPVFKEEVKEALDNVADYANIVVEAMDEPINNAIDELNDAAVEAASGAASGVVKVGTDALAAVPGAGAIIEVGKMANDASAAVGDVVEAASKTTSTLANVIEETSENLQEGLDKLNEKKESMEEGINKINQLKQVQKGGQIIYNRVNKSLEEFEKPLQSGGSKTRRKLFKRKLKSKKVRFNI
jgi:hypothetical protein